MKPILSVVLLIYLGITACAQEIRLSTYAAHVFDENFVYKQSGYTFYKGQINQGLQWGVGAEYFIDKQVGIELTYLRENADMFTTYEARTSDPNKTRNYSLGLNYILLGGNAHFACANHKEQKLDAYGGVSAGVAISDINTQDNGTMLSSTKFAWSARLGGNIWISHTIGIKLQTQLLSAIQAMGKKESWCLGVVGMSCYSAIWQFNVGGGLVFRIGK